MDSRFVGRWSIKHIAYNMESNACFYGKLMLFGEYSVVRGSMALVVPYTNVSACLSLENKNDLQTQQQSNHELRKFYQYLKNNKFTNSYIHLDAFFEALKNGLYLQSTVPSGYGIGSSGALVAAVYQQFKTEKTLDYVALKTLFSSMESFFHGNSSGIDPLASYLNVPVLIDADKHVRTNFAIRKNNISVFLIDTETKSKTAPLVNSFLQKLENELFNKNFCDFYIPCVNNCITHFIEGNDIQFMETLQQLSEWQFEHMKPMIPKRFQAFFAEKEKPFQLKICGSGGGGFLLGFSTDITKIQAFLKAEELNYNFL